MGAQPIVYAIGLIRIDLPPGTCRGKDDTAGPTRPTRARGAFERGAHRPLLLARSVRKPSPDNSEFHFFSQFESVPLSTLFA